MQTYLQQHKDDVARITERSEQESDVTGKFALQAGAFQATASFFARMADHEAAASQRLSRDPKALIATFCSQIGGPSASDFATLLDELHQYLKLRPELEDADFHVEHAAAEMKAAAEREEYACELEADTLVAFEQAEAKRERCIDDGLIGRSEFLPETA